MQAKKGEPEDTPEAIQAMVKELAGKPNRLILFLQVCARNQMMHGFAHFVVDRSSSRVAQTHSSLLRIKFRRLISFRIRQPEPFDAAESKRLSVEG